jgi:hypothetical protein
MLVIAALVAAGLAGGTWIYSQQPKFGEGPDGARLDTIKRLIWRSGAFSDFGGAGFSRMAMCRAQPGNKSWCCWTSFPSA